MVAQEVSFEKKPAALRRLAVLFSAIVVLAASGMLCWPAMAQDQGWSLRDLLFPRRSERVQQMKRFPPPPKAKKPRAPREPVVKESLTVEKAADARVVLVIGDFLASGLAEGLEVAFAENPQIRVVDRSSGSSGFVRDDYYDWPKQVGAVIQSERPAAVIAMMGSNDRQQMQVGEVRETPQSEAWTGQYQARTQAFGKAIAASKVPFLWVGMPPFKSTKMTSDMLAFNDIYRSAAQDNGGEFIDIWDGFADENGAFVTTGPDINGHPVRLRADDGINTTKAGRRKLAFYTEKPLMKILGLTTPDGAGTAHVPAGEPVKQPEAGTVPATIDRTVPMLLSDPALDGGSELLGATPIVRDGNQSTRDTAISGDASASPPGRADNFLWPPGSPAPKQDIRTTGATTP
jgi:hypothetical protein